MNDKSAYILKKIKRHTVVLMAISAAIGVMFGMVSDVYQHLNVVEMRMNEIKKAE